MSEVKYPILSTNDFNSGECKIEINRNLLTEFADFIAYTEKKYVRLFLSDEIHKLLVAGTTNNSVLELFNGVEYTDVNGKIQILDGFKDLLKYFIKSQWLKTQYKQSAIGLTKNINENSVSASDSVNTEFIYSIYNEGLKKYYFNLYPFIEEKIDEVGYDMYDDFNLPRFEFLFL